MHRTKQENKSRPLCWKSGSCLLDLEMRPLFSAGARPQLEEIMAKAKRLSNTVIDPKKRTSHQKLASYLEKVLGTSTYDQ